MPKRPRGNISTSTTYYSLPSHSKRSRTADEAPASTASADGSFNDYGLFDELAAEGADADSLYFLDAFEDNCHEPCKRTAGDHPLHEWIPEIPEYLNELIRLEGRCGMATDLCAKCQTAGNLFRCEDCHDLSLYCGQCTKDVHIRHPLHRISRWMKTHFRRAILRDVGIRIQLGHPIGEACINPVHSVKEFVIIDIGGFTRSR
ncbi:hypothetical protein A0H81_09618 [Grifola frondosa]|uniref:CxC2-like cysteine cluster KDZ transposase-associated domain-containing protein n=1 Tax=Grifola frondosa TaxID=5627 RepID=A0A1C7M169_GRIFR|nr:hypothetical protein A0H81_09618 [Grifola frondosa]